MAEVSVTNKNNNCDGCPYRTHSGAFTPGGAQSICGHDDSPKTGKYEKYHWKNRVVGSGNPSPKWCPLRRGSNQ